MVGGVGAGESYICSLTSWSQQGHLSCNNSSVWWSKIYGLQFLGLKTCCPIISAIWMLSVFNWEDEQDHRLWPFSILSPSLYVLQKGTIETRVLPKASWWDWNSPLKQAIKSGKKIIPEGFCPIPGGRNATQKKPRRIWADRPCWVPLGLLSITDLHSCPFFLKSKHKCIHCWAKSLLVWKLLCLTNVD